LASSEFFSVSEYTKIDVGWGFTLRPRPTGGATALPRALSWFQGVRFAAGGEWREGLGEGGREGKGGMEKGGKRGKLEE